MNVYCGTCCGTYVGDSRTIPGDKTNHYYRVDVGDRSMPVYLIWYCGCSCHWCTVIVILSKPIHVFNMTCGYVNCWNNVGWSIIVDDSLIADNILTDVVGLWLNYLSVVDLRFFRIIEYCCA